VISASDGAERLVAEPLLEPVLEFELVTDADDLRLDAG
jgi:hypothetical protein